MPKLILLLLLIFSFACTDSKENFETSPFGDPEFIPYTPFDDLIGAVIVFQNKYGEMPTDLTSLKQLSRQDYIDACITDGIKDSILVDDTHLNFFSETGSYFETIPSGLEIHFSSKDSTYTIWGEWEESLYSTDFDAYTFAIFDISILIEKGKGVMKLDLDSSQTSINIEELSGSYGLYPAQKFHIVNEKTIYENPTPLCFEEK
ncbi:MAG: hypothetical protein RIE52_11345 [Balneola sp.]